MLGYGKVLKIRKEQSSNSLKTHYLQVNDPEINGEISI